MLWTRTCNSRLCPEPGTAKDKNVFLFDVLICRVMS